MSLSSVEKHVSILTGSNYQTWCIQMEDFLSAIGYWFFVNGNKTCPTFNRWTEGTGENIRTLSNQSEINDWKEKDLMAKAVI